jgi:hypothetical protein
MARTASIILTKEDKKAKLAELNESIKAAKLSLKGVALAVKENDNTLKAATKEHAGKVLSALTKEAGAVGQGTGHARSAEVRPGRRHVRRTQARAGRRPRRCRQAHPSHQGGNGSRPRRCRVSTPPRLPGLTRKSPRLHKEVCGTF